MLPGTHSVDHRNGTVANNRLPGEHPNQCPSMDGTPLTPPGDHRRREGLQRGAQRGRLGQRPGGQHLGVELTGPLHASPAHPHAMSVTRRSIG